MTIIVTSYRYKRPPPKKKGRAVEATVVVHAPPAKSLAASQRKGPVKAADPAPAPSRPPLPTVVVATNQKRLKRLRAELRTAQPGEPNPEVDAFFDRNVQYRPHPKRGPGRSMGRV